MCLPWILFGQTSLSPITAFTHLDDNSHPIERRLEHRGCTASRRIYIPLDTSIRMAVVIPNHLHPHSHPMPLFIKLSHDVKIKYAELIHAAGLLGATVKKVDNGTSSRFYMLFSHLNLIHVLLSRKYKVPSQW
jgi:hypothetical protein